MHALLLSHLQLFCDLMDCSPPGSSVHGISQARIPGNGLPFPPPRDCTDPGIKPTSSALAGRFFITELRGKPTY